VVVTGATGNVGTTVLRALNADPDVDEVVAVARRRPIRSLSPAEFVSADVSTDYYTRLERGNLRGVSESVLEALASALQLDESERAHLLDLARAANPSNRQRRTPPNQHLRPGVQRILDSIGAPAYVRNNRLDLLGVNGLGRALLSDLYTNDATRPNLACARVRPPVRMAPADRPTVEGIAAGADLVLFGSTLTAADTAQLSATAVRHSYDTVVAALVAAVADNRLPVARLRAAALHVALAAHDNLCD